MFYEIETDNRTNQQVMVERIKTLRRRHCGEQGLKDRSKSPLLTDTVMQNRKTTITYNAEDFNEEDTIIFTGQCLLKKEEDLECPVTLQDAVECARLNTLLEAHPVPVVCMYPDSTYAEFIHGWSGVEANENDIDTATDIYMGFRGRMLPKVEHVRLSEVNLDGVIHLPEKGRLTTQIRRIYGGRLLMDGQEHPLQRVLMEYGIKTIALPVFFGYEGKNIAIFAEPDETSSTYAAEIVNGVVGMVGQIGLLGQLPVPSLNYLVDRELDMYSAVRENRIHLHEDDLGIRRKLEAEPDFCLVTLCLSPLTTEAQLDEIGKSRDRNVGIDILMEQINEFRRYL